MVCHQAQCGFTSCFFKPLDVEDLSHWKQLIGLSPLRVLPFFVKSLDVQFNTSVCSIMYLQGV